MMIDTEGYPSKPKKMKRSSRRRLCAEWHLQQMRTRHEMELLEMDARFVRNIQDLRRKFDKETDDEWVREESARRLADHRKIIVLKRKVQTVYIETNH